MLGMRHTKRAIKALARLVVRDELDHMSKAASDWARLVGESDGRCDGRMRELRKILDDYDSRVTAVRVALTRAGIPEVVGESPNARALSEQERIWRLAGEVKEAVTAAGLAQGLRPQLLVFARRMELKLRKHDDWTWEDCTPEFLFAKMQTEMAELYGEIRPLIAEGRTVKSLDEADRIANECADAANFAMMIADVCDGLRLPAKRKPFPKPPGCGDPTHPDGCGFVEAGVGYQCKEGAACGLHLQSGDDGFEELQAWMDEQER